MTKMIKEHLNMIEAKRATVADISRITGVSKQEITQMLKKYAEEKGEREQENNNLFEM